MKEEKTKLKAAMIGVGDITDLHYPAYRNCEDAELAVICDADEKQLAKRSRQWSVSKTTTDYHEILRDPEIDIVEVNTPHHLHKSIVIDALEAGKNVACQKPIAVSIDEAEAMVEAASKAPGRFRVLENFVFYPPYVKAKELMDAGEIGDPLSIRFKLGTGIFGSRWVPLKSELWHLLESENGRGQAVFDDGYHKLSVAMHFFGAIRSVAGFIDRSFKYIDEPAQLMWRYEGSRVIGTFDIAFSPNLYTRSKYFPADERIEIIGTKGVISLTRCTGQITDDPPLILFKDGKSFAFEHIEADWQAGFTAAIRDFPKAIREKRDTLLTGQRALDILKFAFALTIAAQNGHELKPGEITDEFVRKELRGAS